jgi:membrane protein implicated in regulation of membrane protease activity
MNRFVAFLAGILITGLFLLLVPYMLLAGIAALVLARLLRRKTQPADKVQQGPGKRYQQAYARHWQTMTNEERAVFMNRYAPGE